MKNEITTHTVLTVLIDHIGSRAGLCAKKLAKCCTQREPKPADLRHLRAVVQELRGKGHHICAHPSTGYFMAQTAEELDATCEFLYERAMSSLKQISRMKKVALPDIRGQLHLPT